MSVIDSMRHVLANTFVMYVHAHIAHWNVKGPDFHENHQFLGGLYEELWGAVDSIAEQIRASGDLAPGTLDALEDPSSIGDYDLGSNWQGIATGLYLENGLVISSLNDAFVAATEANNQGLVNFLADRLDKHAKWGWMLRSSQG